MSVFIRAIFSFFISLVIGALLVLLWLNSQPKDPSFGFIAVLFSAPLYIIFIGAILTLPVYFLIKPLQSWASDHQKAVTIILIPIILLLIGFFYFYFNQR